MSKAKATKAANPEPIPDFEASMAELEQIVERLEQGDLPLEASLAQFERGVALTRACQTALRAAEQRVQVLVQKPGDEAGLAEFEPDDEEA